MFTLYQFGYSWYITYGAAIPLALGAVVAAVAWRRHWARWVSVLAYGTMVWAAGALYVLNIAWGLSLPMDLPTPSFLASGAGRVLDAGAGSGRAAVGVLLSRPHATVVGLDLYSGYWGIDDNTPQRFMRNMEIAHVEGRAETRAGDMRALPFRDGEFDAAVSSYAIDHLGRADRAKAMAEVARVLKPGGQFLVLIVNPDWKMLLIAPPIAHHPHPDPARWRKQFEDAGFEVQEQGYKPATLYFLARKRT
jgi:SAM-dependent methyltransferase